MKRIKESLAQKNKLNYVSYHCMMRRIKKILDFKQTLLKNKKAFSLVELLVVVVILGTVVAIAIPTYHRSKIEAQIKALKPTLVYIENLLRYHYAEHLTFKNLQMDDMTTVQKDYCIVVRINGSVAEQPQPNHFGECHLQADGVYFRPGRQKTVTVKSPSSGFIIVALGEYEYLDIGMDHEGQTWQWEDGKWMRSDGVQLVSNVDISHFKKCEDLCENTACKKTCESAGCYYNFIGKQCLTDMPLN